MKDKVIINNVEPYNNLFYRSCFYNSFFPVMNLYKRNILDFIGNDISYYVINEYKMDDGIWEDFNVEYFAAQPFEKILANTGIHMNTKDVSDDLIEDICHSISQNYPVILWVDPFYESIRYDTYLKKHMSHTWLIYGYDKWNQTINIIEHRYSGSLSYEKKNISFSDAVNCYDGYIINNYQKCGFPKLTECQNKCGYPDFDDYANFCSFPKINNFSNSRNIQTYYEFCNDIDVCNTFGSNNFLEMYFCHLDAARDKIGMSLQYLDKYLNGIEAMFSIGEVNNMDSIQTIMDKFNNIVNAKLVEKYKIQNLFQDQGGLIVLIEKLITEWNYARTIMVKNLYSKKLDATRNESIINKFKEIRKLEERYNKELFLIVGKM